MIRRITSHLFLFALLLILLVVLSWYETVYPVPDAEKFRVPPEPAIPPPMLKPATRTRCLDINNLTRSTNRVQRLRFHRVPQLPLHLFAAFLDLRQDPGNVVIIGAGSDFLETYELVKKSSGDILCLIIDGRRLHRTRASVDVESGFYGVRTTYSAIFIRCSVQRNPSATAKVGITFNYCDSPDFFLSILHIPITSQLKEGVEICVDPLPDQFNNGSNLIQFVEHHRHIGVRHFTFYIQELGDDAKAAIRLYLKEGLVTLVPWYSFPYSSEKVLNFSSSEVSPGLTVAMQDCLYRRMNRKYPYTLFLSADDAVVPNSLSSNNSIMLLIEAYLSSHFQRSGLRLRHSLSRSGCGNLMNSQWIVRSDAILSMKSHWVGKYLRGRGFDVPPSTVVIKPLEEWRKYVLNAEHLRSLRSRIMHLYDKMSFH